MGDGGFVACFLFGTAVLALWADVRLPGLAPRGLRGLTRRFAYALLALLVVTPICTDLVAGPGTSAPRVYAALFGVALPALVYSMLVAVWMIKLAQRALGGRLS